MKCFVPNCNTGTPLCSEHRTLFSAPVDADRRAEWARRIGRSDKELTRRDKVCERHFEPHFVLRTWTREYKGRIIEGERDPPGLTSDAVPTVFEPPPEEPVDRSTNATKPRKRGKVMVENWRPRICATRPEAARRRRYVDYKQLNSGAGAFTRSAAEDRAWVLSRRDAERSGAKSTAAADAYYDWAPTMTTKPSKTYVVKKRPTRQLASNGSDMSWRSAVTHSKRPGDDAHCLPSDATLCKSRSSVSVGNPVIVRFDKPTLHSPGSGSSKAHTSRGATAQRQSTGTDEAATGTSTPFDELFVAAKQISLPSSSWAVHCIEENGFRDIVASEIIVVHEPPAIAVRTLKTMHVKSDMSVAILVMGKPVQSVPGMGRELSSAIDLEQLLKALDSVSICKGGPKKNSYMPFELTCAHIDSFGRWRHNSCQIVLTSPGGSCEPCHTLHEAFQNHASHKLGVEKASTAQLRCDGVPQMGGGKWTNVLRRAVGSLQETNENLKAQLQALRAELTLVKQGIEFRQEEENEQEIGTDEVCTSEDCEEEKIDISEVYLVY